MLVSIDLFLEGVQLFQDMLSKHLIPRPVSRVSVAVLSLAVQRALRLSAQLSGPASQAPCSALWSRRCALKVPFPLFLSELDGVLWQFEKESVHGQPCPRLSTC